MPAKKNPGNGKKVTRYTYDEVKEPRTPETGHTRCCRATNWS